MKHPKARISPRRRTAVKEIQLHLVVIKSAIVGALCPRVFHHVLDNAALRRSGAWELGIHQHNVAPMTYPHKAGQQIGRDPRINLMQQSLLWNATHH
ncbi:hypothetical protein [Yoonia sp. SS1-5]|uniref:Uncharacterized protein n=1 Tax=Yoonia rhodophyticola TaxID=3137370 RepID=A0AAN0NJK5_9RHOB